MFSWLIKRKNERQCVRLAGPVSLIVETVGTVGTFAKLKKWEQQQQQILQELLKQLKESENNWNTVTVEQKESRNRRYCNSSLVINSTQLRVFFQKKMLSLWEFYINRLCYFFNASLRRKQLFVTTIRRSIPSSFREP